MTPMELTESLLDSKRFCEMFRNAGAQFSKRALTQEDRAFLVQPIISMVMERMEENEIIRPAEPISAASIRHIATNAITSGGMLGDDTSDLGFDPFQHPPSVEPNPVDARMQQLEMLRATIDAQVPHDVGKVITFTMSPDWNANDRVDLFNALGTHQLYGETPCNIVQNGRDPLGWKVTAIRVK